MSYFLAPAGLKLWQEVRESGKFPNRDNASDGWIGDTSHAARPSDHNPAYGERAPYTGIVRAIDLDGDGWPAEACVQYLLARCRSGAERRISYVIYRRRIWSVTYGWAQRYYSGTNPHDAHFHVSLKRDSSNFSTAAWLPTFPSGRTQPAPPPPPPLPQEEDDMKYKVITVAGAGQPAYAWSPTTLRALSGEYFAALVRTGAADNKIEYLAQRDFDILKDMVGGFLRLVAQVVDSSLADDFAAVGDEPPADELAAKTGAQKITP